MISWTSPRHSPGRTSKSFCRSLLGTSIPSRGKLGVHGVDAGRASHQPAEYESRFEKKYGFFRPIIKEVVERYLDCGNPPPAIGGALPLRSPLIDSLF